jgi:uncharacterized protein YjiS (DUF1127 family)
MTECRKPDLKMINDAASRPYSPAPRRTDVYVTGLLRAVRHRFVLWWRWRATVMELQKLRDRELRDIGLARHEIPEVIDFLLGKTDRRKRD